MYITTRKLAEKLGVHIRTVQRWIEKGSHFEEGDLIKVGSRYKIKKEAYQRLIDKFSEY